MARHDPDGRARSDQLDGAPAVRDATGKVGEEAVTRLVGRPGGGPASPLGSLSGSGGRLLSCAGKRASTIPAPARATTAPTANATSLPLMKAVRAAWAKQGPGGASDIVRHRERTSERAEDGMGGSEGHVPTCQRRASCGPGSGSTCTLPTTATPRAPPTWRPTALAADPIPESPWGTDPTTEFVAVGNRSPAPRPISSRPGTTSL